jgi:phosphoglucomutase
MDREMLDRAEAWTREPFDEATRREISSLIEKEDYKELSDRFYTTLEFGTGGMRGIMGAGLNRMNVYTVGRATQGLARYLLERKTGPLSAAISFDSRNNSKVFAQVAASVLAANGITVHLYSELRPTPLLSFTVRYLKCDAGIMLTASHNPREYNGYKVYGADGGQVVSPEDGMIVDHVNAVDMATGIRRMDFDEGRKKGLIRIVDDEVERAYLEQVHRFQQDVERGIIDEIEQLERSIKVVYTPLHGTGITLVPKALDRVADCRVICEPEQSRPDGNFTTTPSPNPEEPVALSRAIKLAGKENADLVIATDPDCDRMGLAVPDGTGDFVTITGNQIGCLLAYVLARSYKASGIMPERPAIITTIVSTQLVHDIAREFDIDVYEVLTGFKWIALLEREFEEQDRGSFIYGFEESYGYLAGTFVRDKDAVIGSLLAVLMVKYAISRHGSVLNMLHELFRRYGLYQEYQRSFVLKGSQGAARIQELMNQLRERPPRTIGGEKVNVIRDLQRQRVFYPTENRDEPLTDLPPSNVLQFRTDTIKVSARPSGTEPKIKFYFALNAPAADSIDQAARRMQKRYETSSSAFFEEIGLT